MKKVMILLALGTSLMTGCSAIAGPAEMEIGTCGKDLKLSKIGQPLDIKKPMCFAFDNGEEIGATEIGINVYQGKNEQMVFSTKSDMDPTWTDMVFQFWRGTDVEEFAGYTLESGKEYKVKVFKEADLLAEGTFKTK
jgi:hypothetical protein